MSAVGDSILTLPVLCALRTAFPHSFLGWVVERKAAPVVRQHECLDAVIELDRGWFTSPGSILAVRRQLKRYRFEIAIDCQSMTKTALAGWLSGARNRIGCRGKHGRELSPWLNNVLVQPQGSHLIDRSLGLLEPLGIEHPKVRFEFPMDSAAVETIHQQLRGLGLSGQFAVINPGASWDSRRWEMDRFGAVAKMLGRQHDLPSVVIWGNDQELAWAKTIVDHSGGHAVLAPATTLPELAALLSCARLFLGSDAGPLHLAVAMGTACVSLHGVTRPEDSGPYGEPHLAIQIRHDVSARRQRKRIDNRLMRLITVDLVARKCSELLERTRPQQVASRRAAG